MEADIDHSDPVFEDMDMPDSEERENFLGVCRASFEIVCHRITNFDDWKFFVSVLLQMGFVDLAMSDKFYQELRNRSRRTWSYKTDGDGRICCLRLEPGNGNLKIPATIRRLDRLKILYLTGQYVTSHHLEKIALLPHLEELKMIWNKESLMVIANEIRSENPPVYMFKSLRSLDFLPHGKWDDKCLEDPETKAALKTILDFFVTIDTIKFPDDSSVTIGPIISPIDDDWRYSLIKNNVGRRIMDRGKCDGDGNIPLSLWPVILEIAQQRTDERSRATGIYYLLREGPVLMDRRDFEGNPDELTGLDPSSSLATLVKYTRDSIKNVEMYMAQEYNERLPRMCATAPFEVIDPAENDLAPELSPSECSFYQKQTRILRRIYTCGRRDIYSQVVKLESHVHSPRPEHLEALFRVYSYLNIEQIGPADSPHPEIYSEVVELDPRVHSTPKRHLEALCRVYSRLNTDSSLPKIHCFYPQRKTPYLEDGILRSDLALHQFIESTSSLDTTQHST